MQLSIDASELQRLAAEMSLADQFTAAHARREVKSVSLAVERRIKVEMPVDTGRARASWGHWSPSLLSKAGKTAGAASPGDAIWLVDDGGLSITQGTNVEYVEFLNAGHSRQAGAGFIDRAAMQGQLELEERLELVDPLSPEYSQRRFLALFG